MRWLCALVLFLMPVQAAAQACGAREVIHATLTGKHQEQRMLTGITGNGKDIMVLYVNPKTLAWTIVTINTEGIACLRLTGTSITGAGIPELGGAEG